MAKFTYEIKIPNSGTYEVESDRELTDAQAQVFFQANSGLDFYSAYPKRDFPQTYR